MSLTSAFAAVTMMPPPNPSSRKKATVGPKVETLGSAISATVMTAKPASRATFLPLLSMIGPADSDAMIRPIACARATLAFCAVSRGRVGITVPNVAATIP